MKGHNLIQFRGLNDSIPSYKKECRIVGLNPISKSVSKMPQYMRFGMVTISDSHTKAWKNCHSTKGRIAEGKVAKAANTCGSIPTGRDWPYLSGPKGYFTKEG